MLVWADADPGAIGPRAIWVDISAAGPPWPMKVRDQYNEAWLDFQTLGEREFVVGGEWDGAGTELAAANCSVLFKRIPWDAEIVSVTIVGDQSGSAVVDIWKDVFANHPPTVADTITAAAKPTLSAADSAEDTTLTGWTKTVTAGDVLAFKVDSVSTLTYLEVQLTLRRL